MGKYINVLGKQKKKKKSKNDIGALNLILKQFFKKRENMEKSIN